MDNTRTLVKEVFSVSSNFTNNRTVGSILNHLRGEIDELEIEVKIAIGELPEISGGDDGVIGESIDCILCLLDLMLQYNKDITEEDLVMFAKIKLNKWVNKYK